MSDPLPLQHWREVEIYFGRIASAMHTLARGRTPVWVVGLREDRRLEIRWSLGMLDFALVEDLLIEEWTVKERHGDAFAVEPGGRPEHLVPGIGLDEDVNQVALFAWETAHAWKPPAIMLTDRFKKDFQPSKLRESDNVVVAAEHCSQQLHEATTLLRKLATFEPDSEGDLIICSEVPKGQDPGDYSVEDRKFMDNVRNYLVRYGALKGGADV